MATAPTAAAILAELGKLGTASYKKVMMTHGAQRAARSAGSASW